MVKVLLCVLFSLSFFGCGLFRSGSKEELRDEENPISVLSKKKCEYLDKAYSAFQSYITCLETTSNEIIKGSALELIEEGSSTIKVACVDVFNQGYPNIPDDVKEEMRYFSYLHENLNNPPAVDEWIDILGALILFIFKDEERECFIGKVSGLDPEALKNDQFIQPQNQEALINQRRAALLRECRKEMGEKAYQDKKLKLHCDILFHWL